MSIVRATDSCQRIAALGEKIFKRCECSGDRIICEYLAWFSKWLALLVASLFMYVVLVSIAPLRLSFIVQTAVCISIAVAYVVVLACIVLYKRHIVFDVRKRAFRLMVRLWKFDLPVKVKEYVYIKRFEYRIRFTRDGEGLAGNGTTNRVLVVSCIDRDNRRHDVVEEVDSFGKGPGDDLLCWVKALAAEMGLDCSEDTNLSDCEKGVAASIEIDKTYWDAWKERLRQSVVARYLTGQVVREEKLNAIIFFVFLLLLLIMLTGTITQKGWIAFLTELLREP